MPTNAAEAYCQHVCSKSFLSLWSYPNPQGKDSSKELCDILIVCEPDVIVVSVKNISLPDSGDSQLDVERWRRQAIDESVKQVYGAERYLGVTDRVALPNGDYSLPLPPLSERRTHRMAVAFGSEGCVPISSGDFGKGFVHVLDEESFQAVLGELDTITDFVRYLRDKEEMYARGAVTHMAGEEDLMAVYLHGGKKFPPHDVLIIESDAWSEFQQKEEYLAKEEADRVSYLWDRLIEKLASDFQAGQIEFGPGLPEAERALRTMAREDRFSRRLLGEAFKEFIELSRTQAFARMTCSPSGILYVYLAAPRNWTRDFRKTQLAGCCLVARGLHPDVTTVVGIATEQYDPSGFSLDVAQLDIPEWTEEDACCMSKAQAQFGWFVDAQTKHRTVDEYPGSR